MEGISIGIIFSAINSAKSIAEFFKIRESLDVKIDKIIKSELNAGLESLKQAQISLKEEKTLLREARGRLNKAIFLEKEERLFITYLALAICHYKLGDIPNTKEALIKLSDLKIEASKKEQLLVPLKQRFPGFPIQFTSVLAVALVFQPIFYIEAYYIAKYAKQLKNKQKHPETEYINKLIEKYEKYEQIKKEAKKLAIKLK